MSCGGLRTNFSEWAPEQLPQSFPASCASVVWAAQEFPDRGLSSVAATRMTTEWPREGPFFSVAVESMRATREKNVTAV
jgi:hypothetical protein